MDLASLLKRPLNDPNWMTTCLKAGVLAIIPIATFLQKRGPGLHHLCFETDDLDRDIARLKDKGYVFLSDAPKPGAHGTRVIFIHPKSFDWVLVELAQHPTHAVAGDSHA